MKPGSLFIVTDDHPHLMRGFDYRCSRGIALMLAARLDSHRSKQQALGRVGRYNEEICFRCVSSHIGVEKLIDEEKVRSIAGKIFRLQTDANKVMEKARIFKGDI